MRETDQSEYNKVRNMFLQDYNPQKMGIDCI